MENNNFFLDIFNNLLKINENNIIIIFDINGNIWFKYKDILKTLQYTSIDKAINKFDISLNFKQKYNNIEVLPSREVPLNFQNNTLFINESGLYEVLSKSTKPIAKIFMNKYFMDIMPQIRKSGIYVSSKEDLNKINELNSKIANLKDKVNNLKDENNFLDNKHRFQPSSNGYAYINQTTCIFKGKKKKCYKFASNDDKYNNQSYC
jgi:prophage antirepressor-like protein